MVLKPKLNQNANCALISCCFGVVSRAGQAANAEPIIQSLKAECEELRSSLHQGLQRPVDEQESHGFKVVIHGTPSYFFAFSG